ncbi:MAG TPA: hypothetical protein VFZ48_00105 [Candidatus Saccharimonadales bacterium]
MINTIVKLPWDSTKGRAVTEGRPEPTYWQRHAAHPKRWLLNWDLALGGVTGTGIMAALTLAFWFNKGEALRFVVYSFWCLCFVAVFLIIMVHHKYAIDKNINTVFGPILATLATVALWLCLILTWVWGR